MEISIRQLLSFSALSVALLASACSQDNATTSKLSTTLASESVEESPAFIDEEDFESQFDNYVLPLWNQAEKGYFSGQRNTSLFYVKYAHPNPKASVLLVTGYSEHSLKYRETAYNFFQRGFTVYSYDHRGHGFSDRLIADAEIVYVEKWSEYVADLRNFLTEIVQSEDLPVFVFAHSMGGAVVTDLLQQDSSWAKATVLNAPLLELNTDPYPGWIAKAIASVGTLFGQGQEYAPGQGPLDFDNWSVDGSGTSSAERFARYKQDSGAEGIVLSGASFNWIKETIKADNRITSRRRAQRVSTPLRLYQAGEDTYVLPGGQNRFCQAAPGCELLFKPTSRHEIYNEVDAIRNPYLVEVFEYFESFLN